MQSRRQSGAHVRERHRLIGRLVRKRLIHARHRIEWRVGDHLCIHVADAVPRIRTVLEAVRDRREMKRANPGPSWNPFGQVFAINPAWILMKTDTGPGLNPDSVWAVNRFIGEEVEERCFPFGYTHAVLDEILRGCAVNAFLRRRRLKKKRR